MVSILLTNSPDDPVLIPGDDRGLAYGDGLFETLRVRNGRPELVEGHRSRMLAGAARLSIPFRARHFDQALEQAAPLIASRSGSHPLVLKLLLSRGSGGRGYQPSPNPQPRLLVSLHEAPPTLPEGGVDVCVSGIPLTINPYLAGLKTLNRLEQVLASTGIPQHCYEALMMGDRGDLREGTKTCLLFRWRGQWLTPPRHEVAVDSVMLRHLGRRLEEAGEPVMEDYLTPDKYQGNDFEGLLLVNSVIGAVLVKTLEGERLPHSEHLATIVSLAENL
ncbi:4-amino-4-deoxychorismate lyase [Marinobacter daqiaonensis]|uniref:branched-chain-amino-acid transaminase n=1 Tax=Marinobacter daqiaonensis TaxID=650891 RepID=A0A1I6H437_9GAMM|nr:aminotransferase class IV [Marinobacter daqiaonensis]SFR49087.1 4-amino-4-deoxychorismate lyase [Marinobacter daqiaonensis]